MKLTEKAMRAYNRCDMLILVNPVTDKYQITFRDGDVCMDDLTEEQVNRFFEYLEDKNHG